MEESSDPHMETDVSSTTDDVLESHEVTASQGHLDTVIVVENLNEDDTNSSTFCDDPSTNESDTMVEPVIEDIEMIPLPPVEEQKPPSPTIVKVSPIKIDMSKVILKSPAKPGSPLKLQITSPHKSPVVESTMIVKQAEPADSSTVTEIPNPVEKGTTTVKIVEILKSVQATPVIENNVEKSPIKVILQQDNPTSEGKIPETTKLSPNKESVAQSIDINGKPHLPDTDKEAIVKPIVNSLNDSEIEASNESQTPEVSEKEHNKSISRELKSLINSAKESKIISECTQLTSKTRKSRTIVDSANTSLNTTVEADKIHGNRRGSNNSQISNCSEKSEKLAKRSMRSQNPEFVTKCKQFLNSVTGKIPDETQSDDEEGKNKSETKTEQTGQTPPKKKKIESNVPEKMNKLRSDPYCWRCHWTVEQEENEKAHPPIICTVCPRSFHFKCLTSNERKIIPDKNWVCPDCLQILNAESSETRSPAMKKISLGMLCELLKYALQRMVELNGVDPFLLPVDRTLFPDYDKYVVHPMDLSQMKQNIADGHYGSTEAFTADAQWILHNSIIFNTCEQGFLQSKLTGGARALVRSCRAEMGEIEACPECYSAAHARRTTWFTDVCSTPHILLWAKLKGFPYWPAKGMTVNSSGLVDVRFFGDHDRAWVPAKDCFLYSEKDPNNFRSKRQDILDSMQEAEEHIRNISRKYGKFVYPPFKTQFDPSKLTEQLKIMIPTFEGEIKLVVKENKPASSSSPMTTKDKRRSNSKSSKSSANDGEMSECDDTSSASRLSSADTKESNRSSTDKNKTIEVNASPKPTEKSESSSRKRRRSKLEEAVLTIMESTPEKKKKVEEKTEKTVDKENSEEKSTETPGTSKNDTKPKEKEAEPSSSTGEQESLRVTPIKLVALPRSNKLTPKIFTTAKVTPKSSSSSKEEEKTPQKSKPTKADKSLDKSHDKSKTERRRNSRNKSINATSTPKTDKSAEKKDSLASTSKESKQKESSSKKKDSDAQKSTTDSPKTQSKKQNFDDNTTLAVLARETRNSGLPTISSVRSLSTAAQNTSTTNTKTTTSAKDIEVTIENQSGSSILTATSTDNVRATKEATSKLQRLRDSDQSQPSVGRVGVRAFARMTSPNRDDDVQVEIKAEPVDLEEIDEERRMEKMDLMNACKLRPVNQAQSLRDVRINKVVVTPTVVVKKTGGKPAELRPRAKKSFPQPRNGDDGRSELALKNSMVYIPIQPPTTQAPPRAARPAATPRSSAAGPTGNNINTVTSPLRPSLPTSSPSTAPSVSTPGPVTSQAPTVGQVPTTVHTVPLMTSVNGQWMFSLQPVMSVGCVDNSGSTAVANGVPERGGPGPTLVPLSTPVALAPATQNRGSEPSTPGELPRLQQRPLMNPFDASTPIAILPVPSLAGAVTAKINQGAVKMTDLFRNLLEECIEKLDEPATQATTLRLQLEQTRWRHQQELDEIRHNHELMLTEMRLSFEKEKIRAVNEARRMAQIELDAAVKLAKSKQWCAHCGQEAQFYCCWNTSYCDPPCQRAHWSAHHDHCTQRRQPESDNTEAEGQSKSRLCVSDNLPALQKSMSSQTPSVAAGGKITTTTRVYSQDAAVPPKTSIIVSMVEDNSGNQTVKCVGTYKSPNQAQAPPLAINKQQKLPDDNTSSKKVVTSGGYLIVGASGNSTSVITPASTSGRRPPSIQYFS